VSVLVVLPSESESLNLIEQHGLAILLEDQVSGLYWLQIVGVELGQGARL